MPRSPNGNRTPSTEEDFERISEIIYKHPKFDIYRADYDRALDENDLEEAYHLLMLGSGSGWSFAEDVVKKMLAKKISERDLKEDVFIDNYTDEYSDIDIDEIPDDDLEEYNRISNERNYQSRIREAFSMFEETLTYNDVEVKRSGGIVSIEHQNTEIEHFEYSKSSVLSVLERYRRQGYNNLSDHQKANAQYSIR